MPSYRHIRPLSLQSKVSSNYSRQDSNSELSIDSPAGSAKLVYEDIAKLNPFYKEYHNFWNTESDESVMTLSTNGSPKSSLKTSPSNQDSFQPLEVSSTSSVRHFNSDDGALGAIYLYEGNEYQPKYDEYEGQNTSCIAALDCTSSIQQSLSTMDEPDHYPSTSPDIDLLDADLIHPNVHPSNFPHKKLFGDKGLLGYTAEPPLERRKSQMIKAFGKKIKKQVEGLADDVAKTTYPNRIGTGFWRQSGADFPSSTARASLDPATQAKLYSDMEYMICLSANEFLTRQFHEGRVSPESIKKINSYWGSKNRPQVVAFHFDQATQRRLIISNLRSLRFDGECSTNPILLNANLRNWKVIVKEMSVRTFCAPDSAIRKHMHDIHKILAMLDTPVSIFLGFEDLQMSTLSLMNQHLKEQYQSGCDKSFLSSLRSSQGSSGRGSEGSWRMIYNA